MNTHNKITAQERDQLAGYLSAGVSKSECARRLNRPRRSILREVKRNSSWVNYINGDRVFVYVAIAAQVKADKRQQNSAHNKQPLKNPDVYAYVTSRLRKGWSPEEISGRLRKVDHPNDPHWQISHETIYAWIYAQSKNDNGLYWYEYLRRKQKKRKKKSGRAVQKSHVPDRVSIHERSEAANNRAEFGHWEGDSVEGARPTKVGLHTEVERMSRRIKATKVANLTSEESLRAQLNIFGAEPTKAVRSTTIDNGKETYLHYLLRDLLHMNTYHADPYSSWQRGTNENGNGLIRCYYPKKTDFTYVSEIELQAVVAEINDRPRKIHNYLTANEIYYKLLKNT